ncbi:MAG TPA: hypothetical protein VFX70_03095 [Mycobacteriales bacterium]|nr:hypothetical protein [Mycobacteriales bacterium]
MKATDPALTSLLDQIAAANADADRIFTAKAADPGTDLYRNAKPTPAELAVFDRLTTAAGTGRLTLCPHLRFTPAPCWWAPWAPGRIRCGPCMDAAGARLTGREKHRCDHCRRWAPPLNITARRLPPTLAGQPGAGLFAFGPIIISAGYCQTCRPVPQSTGKPVQ